VDGANLEFAAAELEVLAAGVGCIEILESIGERADGIT
jgi:hypothetical protein